ncbi:hypothetical protein [Arhodomonas sp. SL1]|uniref:hypothetical protein n=1 Tax=Arhodomonas sp. SL1 TaxID=3425691 RepID=UPI003F881332
MTETATDRGVAWLDQRSDDSEIYIRQGEIDRVVREAVRLLTRSEAGIYVWGDTPRRIARVDTSTPGDAIQHDPDTTILRPLTTGYISYALAERGTWWRWDVRAAEWRPTDPPPRAASMIVDAGDVLGFPRLRARAGCPQLLPDGRIQGHGYHADTGLLIEAPGEWPAPPEAPTREDALAAVERLRELVRYYPWASPSAESAALAAIITGVIRPTLPAAPMFAISAPLSGAGTGKSLLARAIATIATGTGPAAITWPAAPGEGAKRLDATHLAGDLVIAIDNATAALDDDALCTALTEPARDIRELGASRTTRAPMVAMHLATGNAMTIRGDLTRRTIMVHLDPQTDAPDERDIPQDLIGECRRRRGEIVRDVHTILRAYHTAGEPDMRLRPMGDYRAWTRRVRSPLAWLELPDPATTQDALRADDPQRDARVAMLTAWHEAFGADGATAREAVELVTGDPACHHLGDDITERLRDAIEAVATRRGRIDSMALGRWLRSARNARVGRLTLTGETARGGVLRWIVHSDGGDGGGGGDTPYTPARCVRGESDKCGGGGGDDPHRRHRPHHLRHRVATMRWLRRPAARAPPPVRRGAGP